jgi:deoxyribose-phosphate aldolase
MSMNTTAVRRRTGEIWTRSLKNETQETLLRKAVGVVDLTTLEGADTEGRVRRLCAKAVRPDIGVGSVAAVCVYADRVKIAREALTELDPTGLVRLACVAGEFPSGRATPDEKGRAARLAHEDGADEIDMVIDRAAMLRGDTNRVYEEVQAVCEGAGGGAHVKVILECHELADLGMIREASEIAIAAGAGWIKTSTGKLATGATPENIYVMLQVVREHQRRTGEIVGVKAAGGVRTAKDAVRYLCLVEELLDESWLTPERFRIGASTLLDDLCMQLRHHETRNYPATRDVPLG